MGNAEIARAENVYEELRDIHKMDVEIFDVSSLSGMWGTKLKDAFVEFVQKTNSRITGPSNQDLMKLKKYQLNIICDKF
jgi:hypothetical protein